MDPYHSISRTFPVKINDVCHANHNLDKCKEEIVLVGVVAVSNYLKNLDFLPISISFTTTGKG